MINTTRKFGFLLTFAFLASFVLTGCRSNDKVDSYTCRSSPSIHKDIKILDRNFKLGIFPKTSIPNLTIGIILEEPSEGSEFLKEVLQSLKSDNEFSNLINDGYLPVNYNIFLKGQIKQLNKISKEDIKVFSVIFFKNRALHHFLFSKSADDKFLIDRKFSAAVDDLYVSDDYKVFHAAVCKPESTEQYSLVSMATYDFEKVKPDVRSGNELRVILTSMLDSSYN